VARIGPTTSRIAKKYLSDVATNQASGIESVNTSALVPTNPVGYSAGMAN